MSLFNKTKPEDVVFHPQFKLPIKFAFECGGKFYYQLANDYEMPKKRFAFAQTYYQETQSKVTAENLKEFCQAAKNMIDEGKLGEAYKIIDELEYRTEWLFEPETLYRFASVIYFSLDENLLDYDMAFNLKKVESFKKKDMLTHFLEMLFNGRKLLSSLSPQDLQEYLRKLQRKKEDQQKILSEAMASTDKR